MICSLIFCVNLQNHKESVWIIMIEGVLNMRPEVMPFDIEMLGSGGDTLVCSQQMGTLVVFAKTAVNFCWIETGQLQEGQNLSCH